MSADAWRAGRPPENAIVGPGFARDTRGATAVEFGLIGLPFVFVIFAILQAALVFWTTQAMETAVASAARQIYTGQFQSDSSNASLTTAQLAAKFKTSVCANLTALVGNCQTNISIDIRNYSAFSGATAPSANNNGVYDTSGFTYQNVAANQIAVVTAAMNYTTYVPMLKQAGGLNDGSRIIMATATFRTEPYVN